MSQANEDFARWLEKLGTPAPWGLHDEDLGVILAANKASVLVVEPAAIPFREIETEIAMAIITAVNTCAGYKAEYAPGQRKEKTG